MNGDYSLAVHALVYLDHRNTHLPSQILAENICTNAARVRKVMRPLAAAGLAATKEGAEGGYALAQPAADITLRTVAEATGTRSEERRVGKECLRLCRSRWSPYH